MDEKSGVHAYHVLLQLDNDENIISVLVELSARALNKAEDKLNPKQKNRRSVSAAPVSPSSIVSQLRCQQLLIDRIVTAVYVEHEGLWLRDRLAWEQLVEIVGHSAESCNFCDMQAAS